MSCSGGLLHGVLGKAAVVTDSSSKANRLTLLVNW